jgi:hypothetical protein
VQGHGLSSQLVLRSGTRCRWAAGEACRAGAARGRSAGAACRSPGGVVGEAAIRHIAEDGVVVAVAAAGRTWVAAAGTAPHWGLGGRRAVVAGRSCRATGDIAAWGLEDISGVF